jgi:hypothetical protein
MTMGTKIPTLAAGEEFVAGRSQAKARDLVLKAEAAGLKGTVRTTYNGYIVPSAIFAGETPEDAIVGGTVVDEEESTEDDSTEDESVDAFDPSAATVDEVRDYLDGADDTERERVLAAEAEGKARKSVLGLATIPEGAK